MRDDSAIKAVDSRPTRAVRVMFAGSRSIGLFADDVETIADWRMPTPLPGAPPSVLGVVCIRGRILTLLDANALLGQSSAAAHTSIVPLRGDEQIGLAVTGAGDLLEIAANEMKDLSDVNPLILGVIEKAALPISVLNTQQLFATAMRGRERRRRTY